MTGSSDPGSAGRALTERELAALAHEAFRNGNPLARREAFGRLLDSLTAENAKQLVAHLKEFKAGPEEWRDFHYKWGTIDGEAAVTHAMGTPDPDMADTMSGWASANPLEAQRFLENLPAEVKADRSLLQQALVAGMADRDTNLATDYVLQLASRGDGQADRLMGVVTEEVIRSLGLKEAALWSQNLPDGEFKGASLDRVAHDLTHQNPQAAAEWVEQFVGGNYAGQVIEEVGDEWSEGDPVSAIAWLESLPASGGQYSGLDSAFGNWGHRDPVAAGERLASMPRSERRDHGISGYAGSLSHRDPLAAIDWANSIGQDEVRNRTLTRVGQALYRRDAEAARAWVATSGLPAEQQQQVLNPPERNQ